MQRRNYLRALGGIAGASTVGAAGVALSGSAAASSITINSENVTLENDDGDLSKVTIDPTFELDWENFDTEVAHVRVVIEGRVGADGDYSPIFRTTPFVTGDSVAGVNEEAGTTGHLHFNAPLSEVLERATIARDGSDTDPRGVPRPLEVANEVGRPDYEDVDWSQYDGASSTEDYVDGTSTGSADDAQTYLDDSGDTSDNVATLPLVNNYPGADSGYYGAVANTSAFDEAGDGTSNTVAVELRYTFAMLDENDDLVMTDEYEYGTDKSDKDYSELRAVADSHPAVAVGTTSFDVKVTNQQSAASGSADSNTGAQ